MKIYTSYFAQLRNFPPNLVGLSSAKFQPKWLNPGRDKNGAIWLVCTPLQPGSACDNLCRGDCQPARPDQCDFLKNYREQLDDIDFEKFINSLHVLRDKICADEGFDDVDFAILVYEAPYRQCSERSTIQKWLQDNGVEVEEWHK